ncbi:MAG: hypothetical protein JXA64_09310 [Candidatus Fermentibacteraceae bacterium]|nr:hypothetical protein [Candidatus Fermentibacteraceae bacterium]MBN2609296.1 hypothetical protein [Candidatus Fermentibacteraceae bacterium]
MNRLFIVSFAAAALPLCSCGEDESAGQPADPGEQHVMELVLLDSIGVELGDSNYVFGSIEGLGYTPDGNIAVLDRISADIRLYSPEGEFIRRVGGRGEGPGEMHNPLALFIFPDGRLGALDPWRSGLQLYTSEGEYLGLGMEVMNNVHLLPEVVDDSSFVSMKTEFIMEGGSAPRIAVFLGLFRMSVDPDVTYWREEMVIDLSTAANLAQKYLMGVSFAVDTLNGTVFVAPFNGTEYLINRYSLEGEYLGCMETESETVPLTEEEIRIEEEFVSQRLSSLEGGDPDYNVHITDPITYRLPIIELETGPDGNLWARRGTEDEPFFDVWSPEGERLGSVVMPGVGADTRSWEFEVCRDGILAWDTDPDLFQKVYMIGAAEVGQEP